MKFRTTRSAVALAACLLGLAGAPILRVVAQEMDASADAEEGSSDEVTDGGVDAGDQGDDEEPNMSVDPTVDPDENMSVAPAEDEEAASTDESTDAVDVTTVDTTDVDHQITQPKQPTGSITCVELGLYANTDCKDGEIANGVMPYEPQYALWSDGAGKERYISLPKPGPGEDIPTINTDNPDRWEFPLHTRLFKTFIREGKRMETRVIEKVANTGKSADWTFVAYAWNKDQKTLTLADPSKVTSTLAELSVEHSIPSRAQCVQCHNPQDMDPVLGFGAIQLNWPTLDEDGVTKLDPPSGLTLDKVLKGDLDGDGTLDVKLVNSKGEANVTTTNAKIPGTRTEREGLGYLHGNCGNCHGDGEKTARAFPPFKMLALVGVTKADQEPAVLETRCREVSRPLPEDVKLRVNPLEPGTSAIYYRMNYLPSEHTGDEPNLRMPPIATSQRDNIGLMKIADWITAMPTCEELPPPPTK